jgi:hypothetical protein
MNTLDNAVVRWCEDDHSWIDHGDGTVAPSWGYAGTRLPVDNPSRCPEPKTNEDNEIWCADCGEWKETLGDCIQGMSFLRPEKKKWCRPPAPACLKPAVGGNAWRDIDLPFDRTCWCAWWVRKGGAWRLTFHQGWTGREHWVTEYRCLDVQTGGWFDVDRTWAARRAKLDEYPAYLRERWWRTPKGTLIGKWSTMDKSQCGWLLSGSDVEAWVREAAVLGVSSDGQQLTLDVDA